MKDEEFTEVLKNDVDQKIEHLEEVASEEQLAELKTYISASIQDW